ncbi:unnamed protein product [Rhodiola kirilowii]
MTQPEGFEDPNDAGKVCKLKKSIYGLKQASRSSLLSLVCGIVDDILLIGNDIPMLESVKEWLKQCFSMNDLGKAEYILGIKIYRDRSKRLLGLSQGIYIDKILDRFKMQDSKKGFLPMQHGVYLSKTQCPKTPAELEKMNKIPYASAIGSIMYDMVCTRPDIAYALSMCSRYQSSPGEAHWSASKNILKYLRRTKDEYIAACEAAKEAVWMRKFLDKLGIVPSISVPIDIYCDNNGAIAQAKEPSSSSKSRNVMRKYHLIRRIITKGEIKMCKVHTDDNIADPLTKPMPRPKHESHTRAKGLKHIGE